MKNARLIAGVFMLMCACTKEEVEPKDSAVDLPNIVLNEFMASNQSAFEDPANKGDFDDWIEIYNSSDKAVNLGGLYISDNKNLKPSLKYPLQILTRQLSSREVTSLFGPIVNWNKARSTWTLN